MDGQLVRYAWPVKSVYQWTTDPDDSAAAPLTTYPVPEGRRRWQRDSRLCPTCSPLVAAEVRLHCATPAVAYDVGGTSWAHSALAASDTDALAWGSSLPEDGPCAGDRRPIPLASHCPCWRLTMVRKCDSEEADAYAQERSRGCRTHLAGVVVEYLPRRHLHAVDIADKHCCDVNACVAPQMALHPAVAPRPADVVCRQKVVTI
jgi:hypothetical protein